VVGKPRARRNAARAGLRHGDMILSAGDKGVGSYQDMLDRMGEYEPGEDVRLLGRHRTGDPKELKITR
jgi:S1-C subfamily serine protease